MKKAIIGVIIAVALCCCGVGAYAITKSESNENVTMSQSTTQNSSEQGVQKSDNTTTNNGAGTINMNNGTKAEETNNNLNTSENMNWSALNSRAVLTSSEQQNAVNEVKKEMFLGPSAGPYPQRDVIGLDKYIEETLIPNIQEKLSGNNLSRFNQTVDDFNAYCINESNALVNGRKATKSNDKTVSQINLLVEYQNFAAYLLSTYGGNGYNPIPSDVASQVYALSGQGIVPNNLAQMMENTMSSAQQVLNNMNTNNATSVLDSYNQVYDILNNNLNSTYDYIKNDISNMMGPTVLTNSEIDWINFKNTLVNTAGEGYTGVNKQIAEQREAIILTYLRTYYLNYDLTYDLKA